MRQEVLDAAPVASSRRCTARRSPPAAASRPAPA